MHVIDAMAMVMDTVIRLNFNACDRRNGDGDGGDGHCYRIQAVILVIDVIAMVMDIVTGLKL